MSSAAGPVNSNEAGQEHERGPILLQTQEATPLPAAIPVQAPFFTRPGETPPREASDHGLSGDAIAAGYGPYYRGKDPEYDWYINRDNDGVVCES
jgi:micrococcal nuclease